MIGKGCPEEVGLWFKFLFVTDLSSHLLFSFYGYDERRCFFLLDSGSVFFRKYMVTHKALPIFIFMENFYYTSLECSTTHSL